MMEDKSKKILTATLNFGVKFKAKDRSITEDIKTLSEFIGGFDVNGFEEIVLRSFYEQGFDKEYVEFVIDNLVFADKDYLSASLALRTLDGTNLEEKKVFLREALNKYNSFRDGAKEFSYYNSIAHIAIHVGDPDLIELAIEKVQNL